MRVPSPAMYHLLWLVAVVLVIWGAFTAIQGRVAFGVAAIVLGLLIGPGGVSILT